MAAETTAPDAAATRASTPPIRQVYAKLPAQDVERARAFYADKLGLEPFGEHNRHLHYQLDGAYFIIFPSSGSSSGTHDQLGLIVDDIERAVAALQANGVRLHEPPAHAPRRNGITELGGVRAAWFNDSEGNLISIAEFPGGSPFRRAAIGDVRTRRAAHPRTRPVAHATAACAVYLMTGLNRARRRHRRS